MEADEDGQAVERSTPRLGEQPEFWLLFAAVMALGGQLSGSDAPVYIGGVMVIGAIAIGLAEVVDYVR